MSEAPRHSVLDTAAARVVAFVCFLAAAGALAFIHRDDLFPAAQAPPPETPFARCLAERAADVATMLEDGVINDTQAALFTERAEAFCRAEFPE